MNRMERIVVVRDADEELVRAHAAELTALALKHGIRRLRYASVGRLVGTVDEDRDMLDIATFDVEAEDLLGAEISLFADEVLKNPNVSTDLLRARPI